jgi:hypothetical protein
VAAESIGGVVLDPEALLLIISEIRRMKLQLGEHHGSLSGMRDELLQLRSELVAAMARDPASQSAAPPPKKGKMLKMKVVAKDDAAPG